MEESNAKHQAKCKARWDKWRAESILHLCKRLGRQGRIIPGEILRGAAYKLGSGAVTLLILWWQTRH